MVQTLACVLMGNQKLQREFWEQEDFSYEIVLELLRDENKVIQILYHFELGLKYSTLLIRCQWCTKRICLNELLSKSFLSEHLSGCWTWIIPVCIQQQSTTEGNSTNGRNFNKDIWDFFEFWQWDRKSKSCVSGSQKILNVYTIYIQYIY